jgi:hypothetical protein
MLASSHWEELPVSLGSRALFEIKVPLKGIFLLLRVPLINECSIIHVHRWSFDIPRFQEHSLVALDWHRTG